jgi:hypothetical protein
LKIGPEVEETVKLNLKWYGQLIRANNEGKTEKKYLKLDQMGEEEGEAEKQMGTIFRRGSKIRRNRIKARKKMAPYRDEYGKFNEWSDA